MQKSENDSGVKPGQIFKIALPLLHICKAHKKHINVTKLHFMISRKLAMLKSEGHSGVKPKQIFKIVTLTLFDIAKTGNLLGPCYLMTAFINKK